MMEKEEEKKGYLYPSQDPKGKEAAKRTIRMIR